MTKGRKPQYGSKRWIELKKIEKIEKKEQPSKIRVLATANGEEGTSGSNENGKKRKSSDEESFLIGIFIEDADYEPDDSGSDRSDVSDVIFIYHYCFLTTLFLLINSRIIWK